MRLLPCHFDKITLKQDESSLERIKEPFSEPRIILICVLKVIICT